MAQLNKTDFEAKYAAPTGGAAVFKDNTTGDIGADDMRSLGDDIADSFLNKTDDLIDDDTMATASPTKVSSSESTKAYVDSIASQSSEVFNLSFCDFECSGEIKHITSSFNDGGGIGGTASFSPFGADGTENAYGVLETNTASSTAGGANIRRGALITFGFGYALTLEFRAAFSALSDGTNTFKIIFGYSDTQTDDAVDGAYFRYTHSVNGGRWQAVTRSNSTETAEDTGVTAVAGTFTVFKIVVNSTATQVDFYIDGVLTNDITTNIINSSARMTDVCYIIKKTAGSTSRSIYMDYAKYINQRSTAR